MARRRPPRLVRLLLFLIAVSSLLPFSSSARPFVIVSFNDDLIKDSSSDDWDDFSDSTRADDPIDPGSWLSVLDPFSSPLLNSSDFDPLFISGIRSMLSAASSADPSAMAAAASQIEIAASAGHPHAQSTLAFLHSHGILRPQNRHRSFLFHQFAAEGGNLQSKMTLGYTFFRQDQMHEKAVVLYAELAEAALTSFVISKDPPVIEAIRLHSGTEENKDVLRKSRGEDDEDFQITEYQAQRGNSMSMFKIGLLYYYGLRGLRRDLKKAHYWFSKSVEKGDTSSLELLGEMYARGAGVERNYTKAFECLSLAVKHQYYSAYNGLGYLYVKGYGVEKKNLTKAREYFEIAAENKEPRGHYNLGVLYLKGLGVKRDVGAACKLFLTAANAGQPKALYQVAKMFQKGIELKKNLYMATLLYKTVAERGPWSSLSRWALESYLKGDMGKALLLYSRMAELGYEAAQSNAAWILDKYEEQSVCMGESGFCTDTERHIRAHSLWWQASEQGNEYAALLIGDSYYYGRGTERELLHPV
ncbi:ERAD-associated E3 ubiquitin-protein ligase component HRD3-like isoform X1 [Typha latifolia]|uniref:ERAD-associated E3 ubiquitin-protein ligase component HRD3-like isoform X1 n=1 Tax=Typha latifolia TaxID=4733 RepID=UPI003C2EF862